MKSLADEGMTMVVVTHEMDFASASATGSWSSTAGRSSSKGRPGRSSTRRRSRAPAIS